MHNSKRHGNGGKIGSHARTIHARSNGPRANTDAPRPPTRSAAVELKPNPHEISNATIAEAAYYLWKARGGNEMDNWLEAEAMLKANLNR
jgi:hypothetical protein